MPKLQVRISEDQETTLNARALAMGNALKKPVGVPDLIRLWVDRGCLVETAANEKEVVVGRETDKPATEPKPAVTPEPVPPKDDLRSARSNVPNFLK